MKALKWLLAVVYVMLLMSNNCMSQTINAGNAKPREVFVATTPCSQRTRPLPGMSATNSCEVINWRLELIWDPQSQNSGNYILNCGYGLSKQGTRDLAEGAKKLHREGKFILLKGIRSNPAAIVYQLDSDKPSAAVSFTRLNENLLHLLDNEQQLMIGNGAWSYTLNRVQP